MLPSTSEKKNLVIFDLDGTLGTGTVVDVPLGAHINIVDSTKVLKVDDNSIWYIRPGAANLIKHVRSRGHAIGVFTAANYKHAVPIVQQLFGDKELALFRTRQDCVVSGEKYMKPLEDLVLHYDNICILDDNPHSYELNKWAAVPVRTWTLPEVHEFPDDSEMRQAGADIDAFFKGSKNHMDLFEWLDKTL